MTPISAWETRVVQDAHKILEFMKSQVQNNLAVDFSINILVEKVPLQRMRVHSSLTYLIMVDGSVRALGERPESTSFTLV